jgi:DNA-binding ferritin-like protein
MAQSTSTASHVRRPAARIGGRMSQPRRDDPVAALNQALSDVIDAVLDVRQAHRRVPETHALHAVLGRLLADMRTWAGLLADQDQALGVSPLASMPSGASRTPPHSWHGAASDEDVRRVVGKDLDRLGQHLAAALAEQHDDKVRAALAEVERGLESYRRELRFPA